MVVIAHRNRFALPIQRQRGMSKWGRELQAPGRRSRPVAWARAVIFRGHFPDGAEIFDYKEEQLEHETRGGWYVRQLLGAANLGRGRLFHIMAGNLSFQIEHHLFPDVPSNRYQEISPRVRDVCERYGLPYTSGPLYRQYAQVLIKVARYAFPGGGPSGTPEASEVDEGSRAPGKNRLNATAA